MRIASKTSRPSHEIIWDKLWEIDTARCGASTHRYKITEGTPDQITCQRCLAAAR